MGFDKNQCFDIVFNDFEKYLKTFSQEHLLSPPFRMKVDHTFRVVSEIKSIFLAGEKFFDSKFTLDLAMVAALLHDLGRFQQYVSFGTFDDRNTLNHAALSVVIIDQIDLLFCCEKQERDFLRQAILYHNAEFVPESLFGPLLLFVYMLRDADKLDILNVVLSVSIEKKTVDYSEEIFSLVSTFQKVPYLLVKTKIDMLLFRLSWVFDIAFSKTMQEVLERKYIDRIALMLPDDQKFAGLCRSVKDYLFKKLMYCQNENVFFYGFG